jgi:ubiquinone/menaquinone biosynthesis C-methylase UbiE
MQSTTEQFPAEGNKGYKGAGMEGWLARWYAKTRKNDMADFTGQAKSVAGKLAPGAYVLEIAPGPGYFAIELSKLGDFHITGMDISKTFIEIATDNARSAHAQVEFRPGNVSDMQFGDNLFDFIYCSAAFKNFSEPVKAINEMHRVLRPGGQAVIVDLRKDVSMDEIDAYVRQSGRSRLDAWMTSFTFRWLLIRRAYTLDQFNLLAAQSRFGRCEINVGQIGFEARFAKPAETMANVA